jgi:hypothetical protein
MSRPLRVLDMTTAPALRPCPFCGGDAELSHVLASVGRNYFAVECADKRGCRVVVSSRAATEAEAIAAWNTRSESDGERVREAEDRGYKRAAKMIAALVADAMIYSDSYGVQGSDFLCCMACNAGGAPGVPFEHSKDCIVLKCETIADNFWQEQRDELNYVDDENDRLRAELAALRTHGASHD